MSGTLKTLTYLCVETLAVHADGRFSSTGLASNLQSGRTGLKGMDRLQLSGHRGGARCQAADPLHSSEQSSVSVFVAREPLTRLEPAILRPRGCDRWSRASIRRKPASASPALTPEPDRSKSGVPPIDYSWHSSRCYMLSTQGGASVAVRAGKFDSTFWTLPDIESARVFSFPQAIWPLAAR